MDQVEFLTQEGYDKLRQELDYLRTVKRPQIAEHIRIAKEDGDLSENAGYDAAKNEQAFVEGRILTLESILKSAQIITIERAQNGLVTVGCRVTVQEDGFDPETFQIVGSTEADPSSGRISNESPLGRGLLGKRVNDSIEIVAPAGVTTFTILNID